MSTQSRKEELEKKKAKLALIRAEKQRREEERKQKELINETFQNSEVNKILEPDDVLRELGITAPTNFTNLVNGFDHLIIPNGYDHSAKPHRSDISKLSLSSISQTNIPPKEKVVYSKGIQINLQIDKDSPEEKGKPVHDYYVLTYANHDDNEYEDHLPSALINPLADHPSTTNSHNSTPGPNNSFLPSSGVANKAGNNRMLDISPGGPHIFPLEELSEDERLAILSDPHFKSFFDHCTKIVKRVLNDSYDIAIDYSKDVQETQKYEKGEKNKLLLNYCFYDRNICRGRSVTSLDWNTQFPELLAASYYRTNSDNTTNNNNLSGNDLAHKDCEGQVLVWNTRFKTNEPEYVFNFQSTISTVSFAKFHPNLVIGGCYSGQIVIWDNRYNKRTPIQRTPLSVKAHTQPICGLQTVGTFASHSLISLSTDGKLCDWSSLDNLSNPLTSLDLLANSPSNIATSNPIPSVTCLSFPSHATVFSSDQSSSLTNHNNPSPPITTAVASATSGDDNLFAVGCEQGTIFTARRHGSKNGINEIYDSHKGPITEIHFNPSPIPEYAHLFLSSSTDWSVKLWSLKPHTESILNALNLAPPTLNSSSNSSAFGASPPSNSMKFSNLSNNFSNFTSSPNYSTPNAPNSSTSLLPIFTLDSYEDYVYSVQWSPVNPLTFAVATGYGQLDLWRISHSLEEPLYSEKVTNTSLNKLRWSPSGHQIAVGDDHGKIWLYDVGQNLNQPAQTDELIA